MALMALITKSLSEKMQTRWLASENSPDSEILVYLKIFDPCGAATWYLTEQNPQNPDELFGLCFIHVAEWGYVSLSELDGVKGTFGIGLERDLYWIPITVKALKDRLINGSQP